MVKCVYTTVEMRGLKTSVYTKPLTEDMGRWGGIATDHRSAPVHIPAALKWHQLHSHHLARPSRLHLTVGQGPSPSCKGDTSLSEQDIQLIRTGFKTVKCIQYE
ncbi:hypothetical protein PoB_002104600 [Plakobranchus ocellatus]|uniref:Uncharacterized protein n=1 Tax=Plakobranchus ocellatus TaxID=259542 RepID=A0AAV3ZIU2_9GAST|nr:hypothetical protein PoB_002104600 [Plakobranchus ocellatus]